MTDHTDDFLDIPAQQAQFRELITDALRYARDAGAADAAAEVSEGSGLAGAVRQRTLETIEQTRVRAVPITAFAGQRRGSASTSDFSEHPLGMSVGAAWHIARHTAEDRAAGLLD